MSSKASTWQQQLAEAISSVDELCHLLKLNSTTLPQLAEFRDFPLRVPRSFATRMQPGTPDDPLLKQVLPLADEYLLSPGFSNDPVGDLSASVDAGVLHKYQSRVLLIATGGCAIHCRYCFRRHFPYGELQLSTQKQQQALDYIAANPAINEVILSGGDPMLLNDDKLTNLLTAVARIPHVRRLRIHSRIPIVLPARITMELVEKLQRLSKPLLVVIHANHANEINEEVSGMLKRLRDAGITLMNQSVLLRGVNDSSQALIDLSERLYSCGVLPYYLHLLDKTSGTAHFDVSMDHATLIFKQIQQHLPGYLIPKLVREQAGAPHKILM